MQPPVVLTQIKQELKKIIIGQEQMIEGIIVGLLSNGHILIEGVPGLAKTLTIKSLSQCLDSTFGRIQFTPDLLPADITGTRIFNQKSNEFEVRKGPIFANFILADEINRSPAKVQSALLEAMQERHVTIGNETLSLPDPFMVLATQNPLEQEGTYPLPEAQLDRFMLKLTIDFPTEDEEQMIVRTQNQEQTDNLINRVVSLEELNDARKAAKGVFIDEKIEKYIIRIVFATRFPVKYGLQELENLILYGASPRASIYLATAAKARAYMQNRSLVLPEDIKAIAKDVLRHRIGLTYEARAEKVTTVQIVDAILNKVPTP